MTWGVKEKVTRDRLQKVLSNTLCCVPDEAKQSQMIAESTLDKSTSLVTCFCIYLFQSICGIKYIGRTGRRLLTCISGHVPKNLAINGTKFPRLHFLSTIWWQNFYLSTYSIRENWWLLTFAENCCLKAYSLLFRNFHLNDEIGFNLWWMLIVLARMKLLKGSEPSGASGWSEVDVWGSKSPNGLERYAHKWR